MRRVLAFALLFLLARAASFGEDSASLSFVVVGHPRGDPTEPTMVNGMLGEIVDDCRRLRPDVVVLTGDMVWGFPVDKRPPRDQIVAEWDAFDERVARIGAPILRTPGNHDVFNLMSRDVFFGRYPKLPHAETRGRCRLIVLASIWIPKDGDTSERQNIYGVPLEDANLTFLKKELADDSTYDHAFVFMNNLLWWHDDGDWMKRVHPSLKGTKLRAVFSGDYGPSKYTHVVRDGIRYIQTAIEPEQDLYGLRRFARRRNTSAQMDMFAHVVVQGADVRFEMVPVGVTTTQRYTPERWDFIDQGLTTGEKIYDKTLGAGPKFQILVLAVIGLNVGVGVLVTLAVQRIRRRRRAGPPAPAR